MENLKIDGYLSQVATALGIDPATVVKSPEEKQAEQEQQMAMQQQMMQMQQGMEMQQIEAKNQGG
jgi:hypothetical protein